MKIIQESSTLYALLVFIGFYNYYNYYDYFDIEISSFLSISELLLSFLPLTFSIVILASIIGFFMIFGIVSHALNLESKPAHSKKVKFRDDFINSLSNDFYELKNDIKDWKWKSFRSYIYFLISFIGILKGIAWWLFLFGYFLLFTMRITRNDAFLNIPVGILMGFGVIWFSTFDNLICRAFINFKNLIGLSRIIIVLLMFIGLITIRNKDKTREIKNGSPEFYVKFENNHNIIQTDSSTVFIGITEKYLFLRNLNLDKNLIFKMDDISGLEMKKLIYAEKNDSR